MDNSRRQLPASLVIATPPAQHRRRQTASSLAADHGLRSWVDGRYTSKSQINLTIPLIGQPSHPGSSTWLAWKKGASLPALPVELPSQPEHLSSRRNEPVELPAFESRPGTRQGRRYSDSLVSPLSVNRLSLEHSLSFKQQDSSQRLVGSSSPPQTRQTALASEEPTDTKFTQSLSTSRSTALGSSTGLLNSSQSQSRTIYATSSVPIIETDTILTAEPESVVSPIDMVSFAAATGSVDFSFHSDAPSPTGPSAIPGTQDWSQTRASSRPTSFLLPPSQPSITHRSHSVPPERTSQQGNDRSINGTTDAQLAAVVREPSQSMLLLESLGIYDHTGEDDELPDYETSQAEAYAARREEAMRRARELEQSWQLSWRRGRRR